MGFLKKDLETDLRKLVNQEFLEQKSSGGIIFTKNYNDRIENISFSFTGYPNMYKVSPPVVSIEFFIVGYILKEAIQVLNLDVSISGATINKVCIKIPSVNYEVFDLFMKEQSDFDLVRDDVQKTLIHGAYPFFEKFDTLEKVADILSTLAATDISIYIQGVRLFPITLLILKLVNHNLYEQKYDEFIKILESKKAIPNYSNILELCKYLDQNTL